MVDGHLLLLLIVLASLPLSAVAVGIILPRHRGALSAYAAILPLTAFVLPAAGSRGGVYPYLVFVPFVVLTVALFVLRILGGLAGGKGVSIRTGPLFYPFAVFLLANAVSLLASRDALSGLVVFLSWAFIFLLYLTTYNLSLNPAEIVRFVPAFAVAMVILSLLGGYLWIGGQTIKGINPFGIGVLESNHFAFLLQQALFLCLTLQSYRGAPSAQRALYTACAIAVAIALIMTMSRGAWISTLVVFLGFVWRPGIVPTRERVGALRSAAAALLVFSIFFLPNEHVRSYFLTMLSQGAVSPSRVELDTAAWRAFITHPVFGVGPHNFVAYIPAVGREIVGSADLYSRTLSELGIVGFVAFIFLLARIWGAMTARMRSLPPDSLLQRVQLGILMGFLANGIDFLFFGLIFPFPWLLYFVGVSCGRTTAYDPPQARSLGEIGHAHGAQSSATALQR